MNISEGLTAADFDIAEGPCPKCRRPSYAFYLRAVGIGIVLCEWPDCDIDADCSREVFYRKIWESLTEDEKRKVEAAGAASEFAL